MRWRPPPGPALAGLLLLIGALCPGDGHSQGWTVDASGGHISWDALPASSGSLGLTLALRRNEPRWFYLMAGHPLDGEAATWMAAGLGGRFLSPGSPAFGIDVGGQPYAYREAVSGMSGVGATLDAMPLLVAGTASTRVELRSGLVQHSMAISGEALTRRVHQSDLRVIADATPLRLSAEGRYVRSPEGSYPFAGVAAEMRSATGALWVSAGRWLSEVLDTPTWAIGGALSLRGSTQVSASYRHEADDPLYWTGRRTSWEITLSQRVGTVGRATPPVPVAETRGRRVTFRLPLAAFPRAPAVAGDFTSWQEVPLQSEGDSWTVTLDLIPGLHRYAFVSPEGEWFVPEDVPGRVEDGFGGFSATVLVR